eukprot:TRINITY_DN13021_c0_g1_i2.p1 TRINITY_DN13021_c0_g1~~TRINITY_DN13021_c0_g1_i2.p1  ORF type:complete len:566 (-),score=78.40 TRINITY_DN13021_c0_g1_i2:243-1940(-)
MYDANHIKALAFAGWQQRVVEVGENHRVQSQNKKKIMRDMEKDRFAFISSVYWNWLATFRTEKKLRALETELESMKQRLHRAEESRQNDLMKHFAEVLRGCLCVAFQSWAKLVVDHQKSNRAADTAKRLVGSSTNGLISFIFNHWKLLTVENSRHRGLQRAKALVQRQISVATDRLRAAVLAAWLNVVSLSRLRRAQKSQNLRIAKKLVLSYDASLLTSSLAAFAALLSEAKLTKTADARYSELRSRAYHKSRNSAERNRLRLDAAFLAEGFLAWQWMHAVQKSVILERRRLGRCAMKGRAFAIKLRHHLLLLRCLVNWKFALFLRPEIYMQPSTRCAFLNQPPAFVVTPSLIGPGGKAIVQLNHQNTSRLNGDLQFTVTSPRSAKSAWTISQVPGASQHLNAPNRFSVQTPTVKELEGDEDGLDGQTVDENPGPRDAEPEDAEAEVEAEETAVAVAAATAAIQAHPAPSSSFPKPQPHAPLSPNSGSFTRPKKTTFTVTTTESPSQGGPPSLSRPERYALASKAAVSDGEYRRLLELNRQEIRDTRLSGNETQRQKGIVNVTIR